MPRKKKKEKIEEKESEEERQKEESSLEEEIEEAEEEIEDSRFVEFLQPIKAKAPVLERSFFQEELPDFGPELPESAGFEKKKDNKEGFKYLAGAEQGEQPKYIDMGGEHITGATHMDIAGLGRGELFEKQKMFFTPTELGAGEPRNLEKYTSPERFEIEKAGRGNVFEKKEVKYKSSREY